MVTPQVEELQGLYGPFSLTERVVQRIWARGDYHGEGLRTVAGRHLRVLDPGRWNCQEGPDFREARLEFDGEARTGDVEIHFKPEDWLAHGHAHNPNFDRVILHVVLQAGAGAAAACRTRRGDAPETLVLLPLLERDLEAYAMEEALIDLEGVNELAWVEDFRELDLQERERRLLKSAGQRWSQKLAFAEKRLAGSDWTKACHQSMLEVLGYSRNRAPMHRIALEYSLEAFSQDLPVEPVFEALRGKWCLQGQRPANHPKRRLLQYAAICRRAPDWPDRLRRLLGDCSPASEGSTRAFRRRSGMGALRAAVADEVFGGILGGTRLDTLLCDGILPLAGASGLSSASALWCHWYPGDFPPKLAGFLKDSGLTDAENPKSNGRCQGALALFLKAGAID
ncbi:MAG: DUF2851 family protein [Opitutales bacterium]